MHRECTADAQRMHRATSSSRASPARRAASHGSRALRAPRMSRVRRQCFHARCTAPRLHRDRINPPTAPRLLRYRSSPPAHRTTLTSSSNELTAHHPPHHTQTNCDERKRIGSDRVRLGYVPARAAARELTAFHSPHNECGRVHRILHAARTSCVMRASRMRRGRHTSTTSPVYRARSAHDAYRSRCDYEPHKARCAVRRIRLAVKTSRITVGSR